MLEHSRSDRAAVSGHHLGDRPADHRSEVRRHPHRVPGQRRSVDLARLNADFAAMEAELAGQFTADGIALERGHVRRAAAISAMSARATSCACRFPPAPSTAAGLAGPWQRFHELHHARVRPALPVEPDRDRQRPRQRRRPDAPKIGAPQAAARRIAGDGAGQDRPVRLPRRRRARRCSTPPSTGATCCRSARPSPARPSSCRRTARPSSRRAASAEADAAGNLHHRDRRRCHERATPATDAPRQRRRASIPITGQRDPGRAREHRHRDGLQADADELFEHHPRVGGFRRGARRRRRAGSSARCKQSTPLQSGPIPGYVRGILRRSRRAARPSEPGDVIMHNDPYGGASHGPDVAFCVPVFHEGELIGFSVTTAHHLDIGALTPGSCGIVDAIDAYAEGLQFKAIKVVRRGAEERRRSGTCCATISAPPIWWSATWRRRSPRPGSAPSAIVELVAPLRARHRQRRLRGSDGLFRAADARGHRAPARRRLSRRDLHRRLSRRPRSVADGSADRA